MDIEYLQKALEGRKITSVSIEEGVFIFETDARQLISIDAVEIDVDGMIVPAID